MLPAAPTGRRPPRSQRWGGSSRVLRVTPAHGDEHGAEDAARAPQEPHAAESCPAAPCGDLLCNTAKPPGRVPKLPKKKKSQKTFYKTKSTSVACTAPGETPDKPSEGVQRGLPQPPAEQGLGDRTWGRREHGEARASLALPRGAAANVSSEPLTPRPRGKPRSHG